MSGRRMMARARSRSWYEPSASTVSASPSRCRPRLIPAPLSTVRTPAMNADVPSAWAPRPTAAAAGAEHGAAPGAMDIAMAGGTPLDGRGSEGGHGQRRQGQPDTRDASPPMRHDHGRSDALSSRPDIDAIRPCSLALGDRPGETSAADHVFFRGRCPGVLVPGVAGLGLAVSDFVVPAVGEAGFSSAGGGGSGLEVGCWRWCAVALEVGALEVGALEVGALEVGALEVGALEVGVLEVAAPGLAAPGVVTPGLACSRWCRSSRPRRRVAGMT